MVNAEAPCASAASEMATRLPASTGVARDPERNQDGKQPRVACRRRDHGAGAGCGNSRSPLPWAIFTATSRGSCASHP